MIPYLNPGDSITADRWNAMFAVSNAWMMNALGGVSAVLMGLDQRWDRYFFFFDPLSPTVINGLHPQAQVYFGWLSSPSVFRHQYSDAAIAAQIGTATSTSTKFGVAVLPLPTFSTWVAAIYPDNPALTGYTAVPITWLDISLKVVKVAVSGVQYNVTYQDVTWAERVQPFKPIDIFINANFTWDSSWDKYSIARVHNCSLSPVSAFGQSIGAGCSKCFRIVGGAWTYCMEYLHTMIPDDPRCMQMREVSTYNGIDADFSGVPGIPMISGASCFVPGVALDMLTTVRELSFSNTTRMRSFNWTKFWDCTSIYNNPAYTPAGQFEKVPPSGGYFPTPGSSTPIGDLIVPRGKFLVIGADVLVPGPTNWVDFDGFANLPTKFAAAGLFTRALVETELNDTYPVSNTLNNLEIYSTNSRHLVDTACPLVTFITGGAAACKLVGTDQAHGSLKLPWLRFITKKVTTQINDSGAYHYYGLAVNSSGNPTTGADFYVHVYTKVASNVPAAFPFLPTDTVATVQNWITTTSQAGGVLKIENFEFKTTPFGVTMLWDEVYPVDVTLHTNQITFYYLGNKDNAAKITADLGTKEIRVRRMTSFNESRYISTSATQVSHNIFPQIGTQEFRHAGQPNGSPYLLFWHFPRTDRAYINQRYFLHDPADAPLMPGAFIGPGAYYGNYAMIKVQGTSLPTLDDLTLYEWNYIQSFYETTPITVDTLLPVLPLQKTGISRPGAWTNQSDWWAVFSNWMNAAGDIICVVGGGTMTLHCGSGAYNGFSAYFLAGSDLTGSHAGAGSDAPHLPSAAVCQIENYNALASLINAFPEMRFDQMRLFGGIQFSGGIYYVGYSFVPLYAFEAGAAGSIDSTGKVPRNAFFLWSYTVGNDLYGDWFRAKGVPVQSTLPDGYVSIALYEWITIDDARDFYATLNLPFELYSAAVPFKWRSFTVGSYTQGDFFCDPEGEWLQYGTVGGGDSFMSICSKDSPFAEQTRTWGGTTPVPAEFPYAGTYQELIIGPGPAVYRDVVVGFPDKYKWDYTAVVFIREGKVCDLCVTIVPENSAYYDRQWIVDHFDAYRSLGLQVVPLIADNTMENSVGEMYIVSGKGGGSGSQYEYVITTKLPNGRLQYIEIDDVIYPPDPVNPLGM